MCAHQSSSWKSLVAALLILASGCATAPESYFAVARGVNDYANRYRSTVLVRTPAGDCSGVLIAPRLVLSSAHCFCLPKNFETRAGTWVYTSAKCEQKATVLAYRYQQENGKWVDVPD
jgi:V8-like Glu-specific endopeptidase